MSTRHLRKLELLAVLAIGGVSLWWLGAVYIGVLCGVTIGKVAVGREMIAVSLLPVRWTAFLQVGVNTAFFCALMWQIKILLRQARSERHLLSSLGTLLPRIAWLILIWPVAALVATNVEHVITQWGKGSFSWECAYPFTMVSFMFVGVVLLILGSAVERLRRVYNEMQLVV